MHKKTSIEFPASPDKYPFYYGWIILIVGTLGILMSIPGQTVGVNVFTQPLMDILNLSQIQIATAYFIGTGVSGFAITLVGKAYDNYGARITALVASLSLGVILFTFSKVSLVNEFLLDIFGAGSDKSILTVCLMTVLFLLLRLSGQGVTTMVARNMVMKWFDKNRGFANGFMGIATSFGFNFSPVIFAFLLEKFELTGTYQLLAIMTGVLFTIIVFMFYRDNPWDYNLKPFNKSLLGFKQNIKTSPVKQYTLREAWSTKIFWVFNLTITMAALFVTAIFFFNEQIFASIGLSKDIAIGIFPPIAIITVVVNFLFSWLSDFIRLRYLLHILQLGLILTAVGLIILGSSPLALTLLIAGIGIGGGIFSILITVSWPRFFGLENLGAISGFSMAWWVIGSAVGPLAFSYIAKLTGYYKMAGLICILVTTILLIISVKAENPNEREMLDNQKK